MNVEVQPLACGKCGAAVPLGEGDSVVCPFCAAAVPVPENIRELRRLHQIDTAVWYSALR